MGFRGSRVQIPPSRLSEDQALQRLSLWGFFFDCTPCCEFCCESGSAAHNPLRRMQHHPLHRLGIGLLIRTKQRLLVLPAPGFHHPGENESVPSSGFNWSRSTGNESRGGPSPHTTSNVARTARGWSSAATNTSATSARAIR